MSITYVSALIDLYEERDKSVEDRITFFNSLQQSGIYIHLFLSPTYRDKVTLENGVIEYISLEDMETFKNTGVKDHHPFDNQLKNTKQFMILMNAKTEFVYRAMKSRDTTHYAWIDFNISHVFKDIENTNLYIKNIKDLPETCLYMPGCWPKNEIGFQQPNWRFCGGFFIGDKKSLIDFYELHKKVYKSLTTLTWEVNVWSHMELKYNWKPNWYFADHDDSIVRCL